MWHHAHARTGLCSRRRQCRVGLEGGHATAHRRSITIHGKIRSHALSRHGMRARMLPAAGGLGQRHHAAGRHARMRHTCHVGRSSATSGPMVGRRLKNRQDGVRGGRRPVLIARGSAEGGQGRSLGLGRQLAGRVRLGGSQMGGQTVHGGMVRSAGLPRHVRTRIAVCERSIITRKGRKLGRSIWVENAVGSGSLLHVRGP